MKINEDMQALLESLYIIEDKTDICHRIFREIAALHGEQIFGDGKAVADLFCEALKVCQSLEDAGMDSSEESMVIIYGQEISAAFGNIRHRFAQEDGEYRGSSIDLIRFLNRLSPQGEGVARNFWENEPIELYGLLYDVRFIFEIKADDGSRVFPIQDVLSIFVSEFEANPEGVTPRQVRMLQLSVMCFDPGTDEASKIQKIRDRCDLAFIDYLRNRAKVIDSADMLNYERNKVMIFFDVKENSCLIRTSVDGYFDLSKDKIYDEKNNDGHIIGHYIFRTIEPGDVVMDFSEAIKKHTGEFLRLLYDRKCRNVLLKDSIVRTAKNVLEPINPYCYKDKYIVKSKGREDKAHIYPKEKIHDALNEYRWEMVDGIGVGIDRATLGICMWLMSLREMPIDELLSYDVNLEMSAQSQIIYNAVRKSAKPILLMDKILDEFIKQGRDLTDKHSRGRLVADTEKFTYPEKFDLEWLYRILAEELQVSGDLHIVVCETEDIDEKTLNFKYKNNDKQLIQIDQIDIGDQDSDSFLEVDRHYLLCDDSLGICSAAYESLFKKMYEIENVLDWNRFLDYSAINRVHDNWVKIICHCMSAHKKALQGKSGLKTRWSWKSEVICRLYHNMAWYNVKDDTVADYFDIFDKHYVFDFEDISKNPNFKREDVQTLYIFKENGAGDDTLNNLYANDFKDYSVRNTKINDVILLHKNADEKYCMENGQEIRKVMFLTDNTLCGTATKKSIALYLDDEDVIEGLQWKDTEIEKIKKCQFRLMEGDTPISVREILDRNDISGEDISIYSYYATNEAKAEIAAFLNGISYMENTAVNAYKTINVSKADVVTEKAAKIFGKKVNGGKYALVVRKYNQPKLNIFPDEMMTEPERMICLLIKKGEQR